MFSRKLFPFFPSRKDFFQLLDGLARKIEECMAALICFLGEQTEDNRRRVRGLEREADELKRRIREDLDRTFITEMDREDIGQLCDAIDKLANYADTTAKEVFWFLNKDFKRLPSLVFEMVDILSQSCTNIRLALQNVKKYPKTSEEYIIKVRKADEGIEERFQRCLAELFDANKIHDLKKDKEDASALTTATAHYLFWALKVREIIRHILNFAHRTKEASDIINRIRIKLH